MAKAKPRSAKDPDPGQPNRNGWAPIGPRVHPSMPIDGNPDDCPKCGMPHLRCKAHNHRGLPCRFYPPSGGSYCRHHGGNTPSHKKHADTVRQELERSRIAAEAAKIKLGDMVEVDPTQEMMRQIFISAGAAEFYRQKVAMLDEDSQIESDDKLNVYRRNLYITMWDEERARLFDFCKKARESGVEEAQFEMALAQAKLVAQVMDMAAVALRTMLTGELDLTLSRAISVESKIREVMGQQLMLVSSTEVEIPLTADVPARNLH